MTDNQVIKLWEKANELQNMGDREGAIKLYDEAISIYQRLVKQGGRRDLAQAYVHVMTCKASAQRSIKDLAGAIKTHDEIIAFLRHQVEQEGQRDLLCELLWRKIKRVSFLILEGCDNEYERKQAHEAFCNLQKEAQQSGKLHYIQESHLEKIFQNQYLQQKQAEDNT